MNKSELIEQAKRRLTAGEADPRIWPENEIELAAAIDTALNRLADRVMRSENDRLWLQQEFTLELSTEDGQAGRANLKDAVADIQGDILSEGIYYGRVLDADGNALWPLRHYSAFLSPQPSFRAYYCLVGKQMYTRAAGSQVNTASDVQSALSPLKITANYVPARVDDVPNVIANDLVDALVEVVTEKAATK